ncbi:outer membrane protein assembly factor BamE [Jannaschia sp. LMIT008]|uniref:outer membrane protein assembly factor BamE n=1 Tax=Jannaschia maritima TaxID=3032585 RepID=UPI00281281CA|nr:outer membrane protein assembly factor BamE [Jannaschia sp. LMIT008]
MIGKGIGIAALALTLAGCGSVVSNHGYVPPPEDLAALTVGVDDTASVETAIGRPSTAGILQDDAWYYVREQRTQFGPRAARPINREVLALSFSPGGTLQNIERFGLRDGRVVVLSRRVTETSIRDFGLLQQIFRNVGRIDIGQAIANDG